MIQVTQIVNQATLKNLLKHATRPLEKDEYLFEIRENGNVHVVPGYDIQAVREYAEEMYEG